MTDPKRRTLLLWIVAIILLSLLPVKFKLFLGTTGTWHNWGHYFVFLITMLIAAWNAQPGRNQSLWALLLIFFGLGLETSQVVIYHNLFEWHDLLVDSLGVMTGFLVLLVVKPRLGARANPRKTN